MQELKQRAKAISVHIVISAFTANLFAPRGFRRSAALSDFEKLQRWLTFAAGLAPASSMSGATIKQARLGVRRAILNAPRAN